MWKKTVLLVVLILCVSSVYAEDVSFTDWKGTYTFDMNLLSIDISEDEILSLLFMDVEDNIFEVIADDTLTIPVLMMYGVEYQVDDFEAIVDDISLGTFSENYSTFTLSPMITMILGIEDDIVLNHIS